MYVYYTLSIFFFILKWNTTTNKALVLNSVVQLLSRPCYELKQEKPKAWRSTDGKKPPDSDPPENIFLRLNNFQMWNVCQKLLKILCPHSVHSLQVREKYFQLIPVFSKPVWQICDVIDHNTPSGFSQRRNSTQGSPWSLLCIFSGVFPVEASENKREASNVSVIDTNAVVWPNKAVRFTFSWYDLPVPSSPALFIGQISEQHGTRS